MFWKIFSSFHTDIMQTCMQLLCRCLYNVCRCLQRLYKLNLYFNYFEFNMRLIRLGKPFQKQKNPIYLNSQPTDSVRNYNHCTKDPTVSGRHRESFSSLQSCLNDSSLIQLILLIKLIQYKIGKHEYWSFLKLSVNFQLHARN